MKKKINISPVGLKGNQINERMKQLMGIGSINENKSNIVVELTKVGPDGKAYAIVRENHEWYIKTTDKNKGLVAEDFKYIGGLMNKKSEAYPSYAKAIKHLNLKFKSLAEAHNFEGEINVFENDNLLSENGMAGFSSEGGSGFSGKGNNEGQESLWEEEEEETKNNPWAICTSSVGRDDKAKYEACVKDVKKQKGIEESITEAEYCESDDLTTEEKAIDKMLDEELVGNQDKLDMNKNGKLDSDDFSKLRTGKKGMEEMTDKEKSFAALAEPKDKITYADKIAGAKKEGLSEHKLSILKAISSMDEIIDSLTEGKVKKKVYTLK